MLTRPFVAAVALLCVVTSTTFGDTLILENGAELHNVSVVEENEHTVKINIMGYTNIVIGRSKIVSIEREGAPVVAPPAAEPKEPEPSALGTRDLHAVAPILRPLATETLLHPKWSLDGQLIAGTSVSQSSDTQGKVLEVVVLSATAGREVARFEGYGPVWKPFASSEQEKQREIWYCRPGDKAGIFRRIMSQEQKETEHEVLHQPADTLLFSPDGSALAFNAEPEGEGLSILVGDVEKRISDAASSGDASWSPGGKELAYSLPAGGSDGPGIYVFSRETGASTFCLGNARSPMWSPDGSRIVCVRGSELLLFSYPEGGATTLSDEGPFMQPALSPDGRWLAWARASFDGAKAEWQSDGVMALEIATKSHVKVSDFGMAPTWSPDGRLLTFDGRPKEGIWIVRLVPEQIIQAAGRDPDVGQYWWWKWAIADLSEPVAKPDERFAESGARLIHWEHAPPGVPPPPVPLGEACRIAQEFFPRNPGLCGVEGIGDITETDSGPASVLMLGRDTQGNQYLAWHMLVFTGPRRELLDFFFKEPEGPAKYGIINRYLTPMGELWVNATDGTILDTGTGAWLPTASAGV